MVRQTARKLNYRPNGIASSLRRGNTRTIGLIVPQINRHFFSNVIHGVELVAKSNGYQVIIAQSHETFESEREAIRTLINSRVDGVILSISKTTLDNTHLHNLIEDGVALVQFDRIFSDMRVPSVTNNNFVGGREAVLHLLEQGYCRIAHYCGPLNINIYQDRFRGYRDGLFAQGISYDPSLVFEDLITQEAAFDQTWQLFSKKNPPDAIFAASDFGALGVLMALRKMKIKVPEQVGVVGFANEPFTHLTVPTMSTVDQHSEEMGKVAARLLIDALQLSETQTILKTMVLKPTLIIRESSLKSQKI